MKADPGDPLDDLIDELARNFRPDKGRAKVYHRLGVGPIAGSQKHLGRWKWSASKCVFWDNGAEMIQYLVSTQIHVFKKRQSREDADEDVVTGWSVVVTGREVVE